jgi:salicylate hydroxylase
LIAGAGIGGLAAACALLQRGLRVTVLEQAPAPTEIGAGIQVSANGARALFALGLEQALQTVWCEPTGKEVRMWNSGETWKLFDLGAVSRERYGAPYFMIHRGDLRRILHEAVAGLDPSALRFGCRCIGFTQDANGTTAHLESGEHVRGDALIAADGVHSAIRNSLVGEQHAQFTGCIAWRGLVPVSKLPQRLRHPVGVNWIGPGGHVVHYLLRGGEILNFVGIVERGDWQVESWTAPGTIDECLCDFAGWHDDVRFMIRHVETPYKWALLSREPLQHWSHGRVTLLGDAAHPTLPMMAQGANMALEDAIILARCVAAFRTDVPAGLLAYERARIDRTSRLVRAANDNARRFHNPVLGSLDGARRYVETEWQEEKVTQRYDWVFSYDPTTAPIASR